MKIIIFENQYEAIENAFRYVNKKHFNNTLIIEHYPRSQSISDLEYLNEFDLIIIDLDLSSHSNLDGYGLIRKIESGNIIKPKILILTGQEVPRDYVEVNKLSSSYPVLEKPINFNKLKDAIDKLVKSR